MNSFLKINQLLSGAFVIAMSTQLLGCDSDVKIINHDLKLSKVNPVEIIKKPSDFNIKSLVSNQDLKLSRRTVSTDPLAVCNDGSPAVYYVREGSQTNSDKWMIHLKGGSACTNWEDCNERWLKQKRLMTTTVGWRSKIKEDGIFSPDPQYNPTYFDWNHVYIAYCSSDVWSGDAEMTCDSSKDSNCPTSPNYRWHNGQKIQFRGKRIVQSVIKELRQESPFNASNQNIQMPDIDRAKYVLFAGGSAGSAGMRHNLDWVANELKSNNQAVTVRGIADSGFSWSKGAVYKKYSCEYPDTENLSSPVYDFWGKPETDASCLAAAKASGDNPAVCMNTSYMMGCNKQQQGYIETPFFVYMDQTDGLTMKNSGYIKAIPSQKAKFRKNQVAMLKWTINQTRKDWAHLGVDGIGLFSTNRGAHTALKSNEKFFGLKPGWKLGGQTYAETLNNWLNQSGSTRCVKKKKGSDCM